MRKEFLTACVLIIVILLTDCRHENLAITANTRPLRDTVGFARYSWQMDSIMARIIRSGWKPEKGAAIKLAVCPHDDYTYVGKMYPGLCQDIKAKTLFLFGVAHSAARLGIQDTLVFDSFSTWKGPWKAVPVSVAREEILSQLEGRYAAVSDTLHILEHSIEAMIPFLQYFNRDVSIVPVLVPPMSPGRMEECGRAMAEAIRKVAGGKGWEWGKDYSIVVTTDAVHYGNEDWGGKNMAPFGCDSAGNALALLHEHEILEGCFTGEITPGKIRAFTSFTLSESDFHEYKWTWCGRYCVPVAMYTAYYLDEAKPLVLSVRDYSTSIISEHIPVDDLGMGHTAIATMCHWVGYASVTAR